MIKLTNYGTSRPVLVNLDNVQEIYEVWDKKGNNGKGCYNTKIVFNTVETITTQNGEVIHRPKIGNVNEPLHVVYQLWSDFLDGKYQEIQPTPRTLDERIKQDRDFVHNY